ncbi:hypothetical protein E4T48_04511 [Aureobasidium sp. EXF-10727]|nr:hypothetical protein E4T48_04511 [Aureobasidium sp. EXF-10727]
MANFEGPNDVGDTIQEEIRRERRHTVSFLDLPRELREMIYRLIPHNSGTFTYDTRAKRELPYWPSLDIADSQEGTSFDAKYGNPGVAFGTSNHRFAILSTCRAIHSEALPVLYATTPLGFWRPMYDWNGQKQYPNFVAKYGNPAHHRK